jgi:Transglutaminase-like superfamily
MKNKNYSTMKNGSCPRTRFLLIAVSMIIFILMPVKSFCYANSSSVAEKQSNVTQVDFTLKYDVNIPGKTSKIRLVVAIPNTISGRQKIIQTNFSPEPTNILVKNNNRYAEFVVNNPPKHFSGEINVKAEVYRDDLTVARNKRRINDLNEPDFNEYLQSEKFIEKDDPLIQQAAAHITTSSEVSAVKAIYDYVVDNMNYEFHEEDLGAAVAIRGKKGDCTEYSTLFAALCRAKNIPARVISGYTVEWHTTPKHNWVEVYMKECGWVPFDPTLAPRKNLEDRNRSFHNLKRTYLYSTCFNDKEVKNGRCWVWYWGDKATVQDSIEIKKAQ